jgi:hypothetical protein
MRCFYSLFFLAFAFLITPAARAQEGIQLRAFVYDSASLAPVSFANVIIKSTTHGTSTADDGSFQLTIKDSTAIIVISSLGYRTKELKVSAVKERIFIQPAAAKLNEVIVTGQQRKVLQENNSYYYYDFDFYDEYIVALAALGNKRYLQLLGPSGEVITSTKVRASSEKLYKDCTGTLHLLTSDSSYQVYYDYEKLRLLSSYAIDAFNRLLVPCKCLYKDQYFFSQYQYRGLKCVYFYVKESEPGNIHTFRQITDSSLIEDFNAEYDLHYFLEIRRQTRGEQYGAPIKTIKENMDKYREELTVDWESSKWLQQVESELYKIGGCLYLFNFTDSLIEKYQDNKLTGSVSFTMHRNKSAMHHVIVDEALGTAYLPAENNSIITLQEIDLGTGALKQTYTLRGYPFPRNLEVRNGIAYFLYKENGSDRPAKINRLLIE